MPSWRRKNEFVAQTKSGSPKLSFELPQISIAKGTTSDDVLFS
jgi:hypothetical protein